ncbi:hypothetical protein ACFQS3_00055 [Glycomyces mayteni]|uniref:YbaB/EbfC DNA-binding family protein n=1 Tax=Glycomyces mayteni TaxID=543887 RepID=A0ABW2D004_9ACTN
MSASAPPGEPPEPLRHTSPCGNVTVTVDPGQGLVVELGDKAVNMFTHELAELVTRTAREAQDAAHAAAPEPEPSLSMADSLALLTGLRDSFADSGLRATLERQRAEFAPDDPEDDPHERFTGAPNLRLPQAAMDVLDHSIELLARFQAAPPGAGDVPMPVGTARSESKLVTVEATLEHPIAKVLFSKRAFENGPRALSAEINETAKAAAADLAARAEDFFPDAGLPMGADAVKTVAEELDRRTGAALKELEQIQDHHARLTKLIRDGGHLA